MTLKASRIAELLQDPGSNEVFIEMDEAEVEMDTGARTLDELAAENGYTLGDRTTRDGRVGRVFHPTPKGAQ